MSILGFVLKHDDSVNDRSEGSKLNTSDEITRKLWYDQFKVPFARPGSMFRGNPPHGKLLHISTPLQRSFLAPKEMDVELDSIKLEVDAQVKRQITTALEAMASSSSSKNDKADKSDSSGTD